MSDEIKTVRILSLGVEAMETGTATTTERVIREKTRIKGTLGTGNGRSGKGPRGGGGNGGGGDHGHHDQDSSSDKLRIGVWVVLAGVAMMFTALTSAYIARSLSSGGRHDWRPLAIPNMLWVSTGLILLSSVTFSLAEKSITQGRRQLYQRWLSMTGMLGLGFLCSQLLSWRELASQGIYLSTNAHSSFFYLLTAAHGAHLLLGLIALTVLIIKAWRTREEKPLAKRMEHSAVRAVGLYWHFMDGLWFYLFILLFVWG
jgi:cytochrome c oxidase subunit 3